MSPELLHYIMSFEGQIAAPEAELLYQRASEATVCIVEIGSFRGRSTVALALGSKAGHGVPVYAIDPHEQARDGDYPYGPADRVAFMRNVVEAGVADVVRMVNLPSDEVSSYWTLRKADLIFIDGDHRASSVMRDVNHWQESTVPGGYMLFHDRHLRAVEDAAAAMLKWMPGGERLEDVEGIIQIHSTWPSFVEYDENEDDDD